MNKLTRNSLGGALALALALPFFAACGDDSPTVKPMPDGPDPRPKTYQQVEQLARPAINEALLLTNGFLNGYNATAPSFAGVDQATLTSVVGEAKTVLKALYLGACLINGVLNQTPQSGVHPGGMTCHAVGTKIWVEDSVTGVTLTQASKDAAQAYADAVFGLFIPDVLRVDTSLAANHYLGTNKEALCGAGGKQLLCGGRFLNDDTIDVTYNFLLAGAGIPKGTFNQFNALVTDGVNFSLTDTENQDNFVTPVAGNPNQGHKPISNLFPYSAAPF
jgi:hypothetical protein